MEIVNGSSRYEIGKMVAETEIYRLYLCQQDGAKKQCLMQIAACVEQNSILTRSAFRLKKLEQSAYEVEEEFARLNPGSKTRLDYQLGFPEVIDSFVSVEQGERQINILGFRNVEFVHQMVPLSNITQKDKARIDLKTSAWILGKILKELVFIHGEGYSFEQLDGDSILIEPVQHYAMIFDWSYIEPATDTKRRRDISQVAKAVMLALGFDQKTGTFPPDGDEHFEQYTGFILKLARGEMTSAKKAHEEFYGIVYSIWERTYHDFTEIPLERRN